LNAAPYLPLDHDRNQFLGLLKSHGNAEGPTYCTLIAILAREMKCGFPASPFVQIKHAFRPGALPGPPRRDRSCWFNQGSIAIHKLEQILLHYGPWRRR
jgi:hypothetical protein